ncbi:DUF4255 domain-containing protein [Mongoliibacter ruber]|uniref:Uncharacterized protein DUF4255 n=1 Tax=Mongoliibacter ruber TaxID=1750599 RepID=A0A2T0WQ10_9BACT|nr:DUF4255 domain-containing protein [Mongoliibacter ruber]PRY88614.1 uncharacterized protein DUF4255 [Mongoliibacter ruber]
MIHQVISTVVATLNEFILNELNLQEDRVILANPVDIKGSLNMEIENKVCVFLQHIEEERVIKNGANPYNSGSNPPMHFNLYLMIVANFPEPNYSESLRYISLVLEFFQGNHFFDRSNMPLLSSNVEKLSFEYVNLDFRELSNLWGLMGLKYMPSAIFKLKRLTFTDNLIREDVPSIIKRSPKRKEINQDFIDTTAREAFGQVGAAFSKGEKE